MKKKYITITIILLILISLFLVITINKKEKSINTSSEKHKLDVNPISKETAINVLRAEYGDYVSTKVEDIKIVEHVYVVDVYMDIKDSEEDTESHEHSHRQSLGIHKIDMFTGELKKPE